MAIVAQGRIEKMRAQNLGPVQYHLPIGEQLICVNDYIGKTISLVSSGQISCLNCGRVTKKSFSQGYCYPCMKKLARCDSCMMSPEKCHFDVGTCREPDWAQNVCFNSHYVYLANSSDLKVGITRGNQLPTRWLDQGAIQGLPIFSVANRKLAGLVEVVFKQHSKDKTNWRALLKGEAEPLDLFAERDRLLTLLEDDINTLQAEHGVQAIQLLNQAEVTEINYPVTQYLDKITSFNLDKTPSLEGTLLGIKGQYLILDTGVINIRKYSAYHLSFLAA